MDNLETYGDLKKLINGISKQQKGEKIISKGKEFALDQILGLIPGASNANTAFDFIKTAISKPDAKKTNTWLDKLDVDDEMSAIIDDTVENGFIDSISQDIAFIMGLFYNYGECNSDIEELIWELYDVNIDLLEKYSHNLHFQLILLRLFHIFCLFHKFVNLNDGYLYIIYSLLSFYYYFSSKSKLYG